MEKKTLIPPHVVMILMSGRSIAAILFCNALFLFMSRFFTVFLWSLLTCGEFWFCFLVRLRVVDLLVNYAILVKCNNAFPHR